MRPIKDHHHYKKVLIDSSDRVALYERFIVDMLLQSNLQDDQRDSSIAFELKHHHSTAQFARVMARQRNLPVDVCTVGALLHDMHVIKYGSYKDHAHKSAELASSIMDELGGFSAEEKHQIFTIIYSHSDKDVWSQNPFEEFGKDVDTLDSFLYPNAFGYYLKHKKLNVFYNYVLRAKKVWAQLNIPQPADFSIFDNFNGHWLDFKVTLSGNHTRYFLSVLVYLSQDTATGNLIPPTFIIKTILGKTSFYFNAEGLKSFQNALSNTYGIEIGNFDLNDWIEIYNKIAEKKGMETEESNRLLNMSVDSFILVWPAIDSYEILSAPDDSYRLAELGIDSFIQTDK